MRCIVRNTNYRCSSLLRRGCCSGGARLGSDLWRPGLRVWPALETPAAYLLRATTPRQLIAIGVVVHWETLRSLLRHHSYVPKQGSLGIVVATKGWNLTNIALTSLRNEVLLRWRWLCYRLISHTSLHLIERRKELCRLWGCLLLLSWGIVLSGPNRSWDLRITSSRSKWLRRWLWNGASPSHSLYFLYLKIKSRVFPHLFTVSFVFFIYIHD
jgi:hypothetical protein